MLLKMVLLFEMLLCSETEPVEQIPDISQQNSQIQKGLTEAIKRKIDLEKGLADFNSKIEDSIQKISTGSLNDNSLEGGFE